MIQLLLSFISRGKIPQAILDFAGSHLLRSLTAHFVPSQVRHVGPPSTIDPETCSNIKAADQFCPHQCVLASFCSPAIPAARLSSLRRVHAKRRPQLLADKEAIGQLAV
jgi:hypothetical protein